MTLNRDPQRCGRSFSRSRRDCRGILAFFKPGSSLDLKPFTSAISIFSALHGPQKALSLPSLFVVYPHLQSRTSTSPLAPKLAPKLAPRVDWLAREWVLVCHSCPAAVGYPGSIFSLFILLASHYAKFKIKYHPPILGMHVFWLLLAPHIGVSCSALIISRSCPAKLNN